MSLNLQNRKIVPVIVLDDAADAVPLAGALLAANLDIIEIMCRTPAAFQAIENVRIAFPEMLVGAGTVVTSEQAQRCVDAGVFFGLAPGLNPKIVSFFQEREIPFVPGVMTPTEIEKGLSMGCTLQKFFPAGPVGGAKFLKAMAAPYASLGLQFCPTGGVNLDNMGEYLMLSCVACVGGSWIATRDQIREKRWAEITQQASDALFESKL
ncbi:MAG: bifunctional 4-hydroxy-2-oxoglutarate aldolase/2-dehydro-3-deoxy-phosphogluconate aldolase [Opitutales bacterium]